MSRMTLAPAAFASCTARSQAAKVPSCERCVPESSSAPAAAMTAPSMSLGAQPHVGAVVAVEDVREGICVADGKEHECREALFVGGHVADIHAFARERLADETAVVLVADARDHRRPESEAGGSDGGVGGRAAEILGESRDVFQPAAELLAVKVDRGTAQAGDIEAALAGHVQLRVAALRCPAGLRALRPAVW